MDVFLNGFPKKLLVAISIVAIIAMCVMPSEAHPSEHRRRHKRNMTHHTKDIRKDDLKHPQNATMALTKEAKRINKHRQAKLYTFQLKKIKDGFNYMKTLVEPNKLQHEQLSREPMPEWLPTVSFFNIHNFNYRSTQARKLGSTIPERKYKYLVPKLYKSMVEYQQLFLRLKNATLNFSDDSHNTYKNFRNKTIQFNLDKLFNFIGKIYDSMTEKAHMIPQTVTFHGNVPLQVDRTNCLRTDHLAFRGFHNLIQNWHLELTCKSKKLSIKAQMKCKKHFDRLKNRKENRNKTKREVPLISRVART